MQELQSMSSSTSKILCNYNWLQTKKQKEEKECCSVRKQFVRGDKMSYSWLKFPKLG